MKNQIDILRVFADEKGESHFGYFQIELNESGEIGFLSKLYEAKGIIFRKTPSNYNFDFHVAPRKQYIINLDASVEVECSDGEKRVIEAGTVFFVEDTFGKGHRSKAINNKERMSVFIPIEYSD